MTTWVDPERTGRDGTRPTIRGADRLSGQVRTASVASTDRASWVLSRWQILAFALEDGYDVSRVEAGRASTVSLVVLALESGYGANEWRWNAAGVGCAGAVLCMRFTDGASDPELRAYEDLAAGARDFWRLVKRNARGDEWSRILAGDMLGWAGLWRRGDWSAGNNTGDDLNTILTRVVTDLRAASVASDLLDVRPLPAGYDVSRRRSGDGGSSSSRGSSVDVTPRAKKKSLGLLALGALALYLVGKGR